MNNTQSWSFKIALFGIAATTILGPTLLAPSLPNLQEHFKDIAYIQTLSKLILTLPALFIMIFSPIAGFVLAKGNKLKIIFSALIVWSLVGASGYFLDNIYLLLLSRAILGVATAFIMTGIGTLLGDYYKGVAREKMLGLQNFFMAFGGAIFLIIGGLLANISWKYPFLVYLSGIFILIYAIFKLCEPPHIAHTSTHSKHLAFRIGKFIPIYGLAFFAMAVFYMIPTQIPFFITHILQKPNSSIGVSMATASVATAIFGLFYNRLRSYLSIARISSFALMLMGCGFLCIGVFHSYIMLLIALILIGASLAFFLVNNSSWLFALAKDYERPKAYGFLASFLFMGQFSSPFITQPFVEYFGLTQMFVLFGCVILGFCFISLFYNPNITFSSQSSDNP